MEDLISLSIIIIIIITLNYYMKRFNRFKCQIFNRPDYNSPA